jgi:hypothetical protein
MMQRFMPRGGMGMGMGRGMMMRRPGARREGVILKDKAPEKAPEAKK